VSGRSLAALLAIAAATCGGPDAVDPASAGLRVEIDTVAGVEHVRNAGSPPEWSLAETLTLGSSGAAATAAGDDEFGHVAGVVGDTAGRVYVADAMSADIRAFDAEGRLLRRIGRRGAGPGEFIGLISLGRLGDGLAALDVATARLGVLSAEGEWLGQQPYRGGDVAQLLAAGGGALYMPSIVAGPSGRELRYVVQTAAGPTDTLRPPPLEAREQPQARCTYGGDVTAARQASFAPRQLRVPAPDMQWADVWTADYRIVFLTPAGDTVRIVERDVRRRAVTDSAWQAETAAFDAFLAEHPDAACDRRTLPRPDAMTLVRAVFFDDDGRMWVERLSDAGTTLDVFDTGGRLLGLVGVPDRFERVVPHVLGDRLHMVVADSLGVQAVRVYRVIGMSAGT
jgi:hypothetical protein